MIDIGNTEVAKTDHLLIPQVLRRNLPMLLITHKLTPVPLEKEYPQAFKILNYGEIQRMQEGIIHFINSVTQNKIDAIFFLDKSGRPASYLFKKIWEQVFPDIKSPDIKFINIPNSSKEDTDKLIESEQRIIHLYGNQKGRHLCVADEYVETGDTFNAARRFFRKIFPEAESIMYSGIFKAPPSWRGQESFIGVADGIHENRISSILSTPLHMKMMYQGQKTSTDIYSPAQNLRAELSTVAQLISRSVSKV